MMMPREESEMYLLITRHLAFETSIAEDERLHEWIAQSKENELVFQQLKTIWLSGRRNTSGEAETVRALADLKDRMATQFEEPLRTQRPSRFEELSLSGERLGRGRRWVTFAAASVIVIAGAFLGLEKWQQWFSDKPVYLEKAAMADRAASLILSDGTFVCLSPGSRIIYPQKFTSDNRKVTVRGQAFFRVSKDPHQPFVVESGRFLTEVLGTAFTISAFDNQEEVSIALVEGRIRVTDSAHLFNCLLQPGKEFLYNKNTNETSVRDIGKKEDVTAWMNRELVFNNITLAEAASQIQAVYGVRLVFGSKAAADCLIWGRFKNETLTNILETIKLAGNIQYAIQPPNTVFISKK